MPFFTKSQKRIAAKTSETSLQSKYEHTELELQKATRTGNIKAVKAAMKKHHDIEYALLYKRFGRK